MRKIAGLAVFMALMMLVPVQAGGNVTTQQADTEEEDIRQPTKENKMKNFITTILTVGFIVGCSQAPVEEAPVEEAAPMAEEAVPAVEEAAPMTEESAPMAEETAPMAEEAAPAAEEAEAE